MLPRRRLEPKRILPPPSLWGPLERAGQHPDRKRLQVAGLLLKGTSLRGTTVGSPLKTAVIPALAKGLREVKLPF